MFNLDNLIRDNIRSLQSYSSARNEYSGDKGTFLDANENPFGQHNRYPDPYQTTLKSFLAEQKGIGKEKIFVGNGSDEVIDLLYRIFCNPGIDKALTFSPTYGMYDVSAAINDIQLIKLPLNDSFDIDFNKTMELLSIDKFKLIFICNPNNPTGNTFSRSLIEQIIKLTNGILVVDEAYIDFSTSSSFIDLIDSYPNLIVTQTMSKARGLASARIGFAFSNSKIIELLNKVKPPYNVSGLNQQVALDTLRDSENFETGLKLILSERMTLEKKLSALESVVKIYPSQANFLLVKFIDAEKIYKHLVELEIIVRNRTKIVSNCIRITVGSPAENRKLLEALKKIEHEESIVY